MSIEPPFSSLELLASKAMLDRIQSDDLPRAAQDLLEEGLDTPSLRVLAILLPDECDRAKSLLDRVLSESGLQAPTHEQATLRVAEEIAQNILDGIEEPSMGSQKLARLCSDADHNDALIAFVMCEDFHSVVAVEEAMYEKEIIKEAELFLSRQRNKGFES